MANRAYKLAQKSAVLQREALLELEAFVQSIARGEKMIIDLKGEMEAVGLKHQDRKTTRDDIAYLEDLLRCAKKKLAWEKKMESLRKQTPEIFDKVSKVINDPKNPPTDQTRDSILEYLQSVKAAMERLDQAQHS